MNISYSVYLYFYFDNVILVLDKKKYILWIFRIIELKKIKIYSK